MSLAMRPKIALRQSQALVMTPQLRQSIEMLQMTTLELNAFLAREVEANPVLSLSDGLHTGAAPAQRAEAVSVDVQISRGDFAAGAAQFPTGRENLPGAGEMAATHPRAGGDGLPDSTARMVDAPSLSAAIMAQLGQMNALPGVTQVACLLAGELDEDGYLRLQDDEYAALLKVEAQAVTEARRAIQACEPTGVGARDLAEALALQLEERNRLDPAMARLLELLDCLPTTPAAILARECGVDREDLRQMLAELRALDPRPGRRHGAATAAPVAPDVIVQPDGDGGWHVRLDSRTLPRLLIDRDYAAKVSATDCPKARSFVADCLQNASWLRRSLDQRAKTILAVATEIVRVQAAFLEQGGTGLKPLTLRDVAESIGMHESTVSRVTANKMMQTPRGTVPMKLFFNAAIAAVDGGEAHAAEAVRERIRALVAAEPPQKPLSDDMLVRCLSGEGIEVARRTVAKYREALRIPSSVERRRRAAAAV